MTTLRQAAQAVLDRWDSPRWTWHLGPTADLMATLRAALAEPVQEPEPGEYHGWVLREVLFDNGEPIGHREPVQEPVAWLTPRTLDSYMRPDLGYETCSKSDYGAFPVYTAQPQRKTLTDEEIDAEWRKAASEEGFTTAQFVRTFARAIVRAAAEIGRSKE